MDKTWLLYIIPAVMVAVTLLMNYMGVASKPRVREVSDTDIRTGFDDLADAFPVHYNDRIVPDYMANCYPDFTRDEGDGD